MLTTIRTIIFMLAAAAGTTFVAACEEPYNEEESATESATDSATDSATESATDGDTEVEERAYTKGIGINEACKTFDSACVCTTTSGCKKYLCQSPPVYACPDEL